MGEHLPFLKTQMALAAKKYPFRRSPYGYSEPLFSPAGEYGYLIELPDIPFSL